jgi:hypothetical protein
MSMFFRKIARLMPRRFAQDGRGSVSVETLIIFPILAWALVATVVFFDGFRTRNQTQVAAQIVADLLSREANMFTPAYLEGMNEVFDFIADAKVPTRLRISSVMWSSSEQRNQLQWSYGTRGLAPLPPETFEDLANDAYPTLVARFNAMQGNGFDSGTNQVPAPWLADRIPPVLPGEALIMVESFAIWSPFANVGVGQMRFSPVIVTRPRFSPFIQLEGAVPVFPEDDYEVAFAGYTPAPNTQLPDPTQPPPPPPPPPVVTDPPISSTTLVDHQTFTSGVTTGWSSNNIGTSAATGNFLGPFGGATLSNPVTRNITLPAGVGRVRIQFDLLVIDSWDGFDPGHTTTLGDTLALQINGTTIALNAFQWSGIAMHRHARQSSVALNGSTWTVNMTRIQSGTNLLGSHWQDERWRVIVTGDAPPRNFSLGFSASINSPIDDEAFGIADFRITAEPGTPQAPAFWPTAATLLGIHPQTRFQVHSGCPDPRIAAPVVRFDVTDLPGAGLPTAPGTADGLTGAIGQVYSYRVTGSTSGTIWGTDIYTDDSTIARAAIHAGLVTSGQTRDILLTLEPGRSSYTASSRNGVTSLSWGAWGRSYSLAARPTQLTQVVFPDNLRQAGGGTLLTTCPGHFEGSFFHASPLYVFEYNNEGLSGTGFRLRIDTNDNNNGRNCDSALLVRDPNGQFWFNEDTTSTNWNARLNLGNAPSGTYHVWMGTWGGATCATRFMVSRY